MSLQFLTIPTERTALVSWLEHHITGIDLGKLVAELSVIHNTRSELSLRDVCGGQLNEVLESGLSVLSDESLGCLLTNPMTLLELQDQREAVARLQRRLQANQHQVRAAGLEFDCLAGRQLDGVELAHAHHVALHAHGVQLHTVRSRSAG